MPKLIICGGASGAGKSFLLENITILHNNIVSVKKLTTRGPRPFETPDIQRALDLEFNCSIQEVTACDYVYRYGHDWYGSCKADIDAILKQGNHAILIVRDCETIHDIKKDYSDTLALYLQSVLSGEDLRQKLVEQGRNDIDVGKRMRRIQQDFHDYVSHVHLFDHVLINYYESDSLIGQMRTLLRHVLQEDQTFPDFVFVLMPFRKELDEVFDAIEAAGKLLNGKRLTIERVDMKKGGAFDIPAEIFRSIRQAGVIVGDVTEHNPNVFYELGYARGLGKHIIHCAKQENKLPFDIGSLRALFYTSPMDLQKQMVEEFRHFVSLPSG